MKTHITKTLGLLTFLSTVSVLAQELPEIVPPSPTVANLMQFEEVPVSYYTGQPNISVPLYNKQLGSDLSMGIGLQYNTQGIKIDNRSGWVGTGWSLMAGGTISRVIRDVPDEAIKGNPGFSIKTGIYHNPTYWSYDALDPLGSARAEFNWKAQGSSVDKYDISPDLFQYNFMGHSGRFVVLKVGGTLVAEQLSKTNNLVIVPIFNWSTYVIDGFMITDTKGYKYTFGGALSDAIESTTTYNMTETMPQGDDEQTGTTGSSDSYTVRTAWHLKKIRTSNNRSLATFSYTGVAEGYTGAPSRIDNRIRNTEPLVWNEMLHNTYNTTIFEPRYVVSQTDNSTQTKKLSSIQFEDGTSIDLQLSSSAHPELGLTSKYLQHLIVKDTIGAENKRYTFDYATVANRLWLDKVSEMAGGTTLDTEFAYHNRSALPVFGDGLTEGDAWGYYSGIGEDLGSCAATPFDQQQVNTGLLTRITYPTGGVKEFVFEHNTYSFYGDQQMGYDDYISNPMNRSPAPSLFIDDHEYIHLISDSPQIITSFTIDFDQDVYLSSWMNSGSPNVNEHVLAISGSNFYAQVELDQTCVKIPNVPAGTYNLLFAIRDTELSFTYTISGDYRVNYTQQALNLRHELLGGGVRIKEIIFRDGPLAAESKKIRYGYNDIVNDVESMVRSSGVIDASIDQLTRNYVYSPQRALFNDSERSSVHWGGFHPVISYDVIQHGPNMNSLVTNGAHVGYRAVKVSETGNGYQTYTYTSAQEHPHAAFVFSFPESQPAPNIDYKRGLLKKHRIYNEAGDILKEVENTSYTFREDFIYKERSTYKPNCKNIQFFDTWAFYDVQPGDPLNAEINIPTNESGNPVQTIFPRCGSSPIQVFSTNINSGWARLEESITKEYFYDALGNQSVTETRENYSYNDDNYQVATKNSYYNIKGTDEHLQTKYYYPVGTSLSSNPTAVKDKMVAANLVNEVLETQSFRNGTQINEAHNIFHDFDDSSQNLMQPMEVKVSQSSLVPETRIEFVEYDSYGNPTEVKKADGTSICYIYGFNGSLPVAKIVNGDYGTIESTLGTGISPSGNLGPSQESSLRSALPNAMLSFYRYDPIKGLTSMVDDRGYLTTYEYDAFNRLIRTKDANGKILSENTYRYKNQSN